MVLSFIKHSKKYLAMALILLLVTFLLWELIIHFQLFSDGQLSRFGILFGFLFSFISFIFASWKEDYKQAIEVDRINLMNFLKLLPQNEAMSFFESHPMQLAYPTMYFSQLVATIEFYNKPGRKFKSNELNTDFNNLIKAITAFVEKLSNYTSPIDSNMSGIPRELELSNEGLFLQRAKELDTLASEMFDAYGDFVEKWALELTLKH